MTALVEQLDDFMHQVDNLVPNTKEKSQITKAGAEVLKHQLRAVTLARHYSNHDDKAYGHMADHIDYVNTDEGGEVNGNSTVGWNNPYHAANARRLNDGTKFYTADHFVDNTRTSAAPLVLAANAAKYQEIMNRR